MKDWVEHCYADAGALSTALSEHLYAAAARAIKARGGATLVLAGGSTPLPAYRALAELPLDWSRVVALPGDERCVPHTHLACNLRQIASAFAAAPALRLAELTPSDGNPDVSAAHANAVLSGYPAAFDALVLGMGRDAHTASLFPGAAGLTAALDPLLRVDACRIDPQPLPPEAPFPRVTMTLSRLVRTRELHLVITGADKREVLRRACAGDDRLGHPVAAVLHAASSPIHLHWSP